MNMVYDSIHDFLYTGIGFLLGTISGQYYQFVRMRREMIKNDNHR